MADVLIHAPLPGRLESRPVLTDTATRTPLPPARRVKVMHHTPDGTERNIPSPIVWHREIRPGMLVCLCLLDTEGRTGRFELQRAIFDMLPETVVEW